MPLKNSDRKIALALSSSEETELLADKLQAQEYDIEVAPDGKGLIDLVRSQDIDLVLIDTHLPGSSGFEVCREIRKSTTEHYIPVIMLRAKDSSDTESVLECFNAGADDCLTRPYSIPELLARVSKFLHSYEQEAMLRQQQSMLERRVETQSYKIRRLRDLNREIVSAIPSLILVLDSEQKVLYANPSFKDKLGFEESVIRDTYFADLIADNITRKDELLTKIRQVAQEGGTGVLHDVYYDAGPGRRNLFFDISIAPITAEEEEAILLVLDDVTETARRRDVMTMLRSIAQSIQGTLDLDRVLFTILTCATAGVAIGFSRTFLFLINEERQSLDGEMAVGPTSLQDAIRVWSELSKEQRTLEDLLAAYDRIPEREEMPLHQFIKSVRFPLRESREVPVLAVRERRTFVVANAPTDSQVSDSFLEKFKCDSFVVVPMIARNRVIGAALADNAYSGRPIIKEQVDLLEAFVGQAAMAVDSAESYQSLQDKVEKLAKAYEDLRTAKERVMRAEQLATIGDMSARVAHEIRNPLVTIGGFARAINRNPDKTSRIKSNSWIIVQEVERLERILSNIMNFAKPPSPMFELQNINRIVDDTVHMLKDEVEKHGIIVDKRLDESIPLVMIDAQQIKQVLFNLMHNAVSALEGEGKLVVTTENLGNYFEVHIADTGRGIPEELKEKIFTPFFTTKSAGTGLGLPIVKKIVDDHEGTISYHSTVGEGTTFVLRLPISSMPQRSDTKLPELPPDLQSDR
jgi:PAS domain S-box-containing protein